MNDADGQDMDVVTVTRDEALLDALGRGEPPPVGDEVATLLAAWRADLGADLPAGDIPGVRPAAPASPAVRDARRPRLPLVRAGLRAPVAAAAALVAIAGALTIGAANAGPDSPLWPITKVVYEERADSRAAQQQAERAIAQAREAVTQTRYADAAGLLDRASALIDKVRDERVAQRLRDEVSALRARLPGGTVVGPTPTGPAGGIPPAGGTTPDPNRSPGAAGTPGLPLPGVSVPGLPLPSDILPSDILPSEILPGLPLPPLPLPGLH